MVVAGLLLLVVISYFNAANTFDMARSSTKPSDLLHFQPVCEGSDPNLVRIAQAELCRHGIDVEIDGDCGKATGLGMCELLVKIENGYKIRSIYEKRLSGD